MYRAWHGEAMVARKRRGRENRMCCEWIKTESDGSGLRKQGTLGRVDHLDGSLCISVVRECFLCTCSV